MKTQLYANHVFCICVSDDLHKVELKMEFTFLVNLRFKVCISHGSGSCDNHIWAIILHSAKDIGCVRFNPGLS